MNATMTIDEIATSAFEFWKTGITDRPFCVLGHPGIGKTSIHKVIANKMFEYRRQQDPDAKPPVEVVIDLSNKTPEDTAGLPNFHIVDEQSGDGWVKFLPLKWMYDLSAEDVYGVLVLDDITQASGAVQCATRQLILQGEIDGTKLNPNIVVLVTGNHQTDGARASTLPSHFRNSVSMTTMEVSVQDWTKWYGHQKDLDPIVSSFIDFKNNLLSQLPQDADDNGAFATPRQWEAVGRRLPQLRRLAERGRPLLLLRNVQALVGQGPAQEFYAYYQMRSRLPPMIDIIDNPVQAIPNPYGYFEGNESLRHAAVTGVMETAARLKTQDQERLLYKATNAMLHLLSHRNDLGVVGILTYQNNGGDKNNLKRIMTNIYKDPSNPYQKNVKHLLEAFREAMQ